MKQPIYELTNKELKAIILWCENPNKDENFDLDILYSRIFREYNIDMSFGVLRPIFNLVDILCDAIRHGQKNINQFYSVKEAIADLKSISKHIEDNKIDIVENDLELIRKLNRLYDT